MLRTPAPLIGALGVMIISVTQYYEEATLALRAKYDKYTVAILTGKRGREPTFIGSGFCLRRNSRNYIVTAGHVADSVDDGLYLGRRTFGSFESDGFRSRRESEQFDIAVLPISEDKMSEVGIEAIDELQIDRHEVYTEGLHCLIGYPASKNKPGKAVQVGNKQINATCFGINTQRVDVDYSVYRKNKGDHIAIAYDTVTTPSGRFSQPPSLKGVSGAPLWVTRDILTSGHALLAGLLIEHFKSPGVAFCTKIQHVIGFIDARDA